MSKKPCPFCGNAAIATSREVHYDNSISVRCFCNTCRATGPTVAILGETVEDPMIGHEKAIAAWNKRV